MWFFQHGGYVKKSKCKLWNIIWVGMVKKSMEGEFIDLLSSIHDIILLVIMLNIEFF
jgi:hypothetical protein